MFGWLQSVPLQSVHDIVDVVEEQTAATASHDARQRMLPYEADNDRCPSSFTQRALIYITLIDLTFDNGMDSTLGGMVTEIPFLGRT